MQYANMIDLLNAAEEAGAQLRVVLNDRVAAEFESWIRQWNFGEITEEEEDALRLAFEKGIGLSFHNAP